MELIVRNYSNLNKAMNALDKAEGDIIIDLVYATEVGFVETHNNRDFYHSHLFCFHYCIDKYQGDRNLSFTILDSNQQTGQYCFWDYTSNFYKDNAKSKKLQIENAQLTIPFEKVFYDSNKSFHEVIKEIKKDLWDKHNDTLKLFTEKNIGYDSSMNLFSKELKAYIDISYDDLFKLELAPKIKQYEAHVLSEQLSEKPTSRKAAKI